MIRIAAAFIAGLVMVAQASAADEPIACADAGEISQPAQAFGTYCGRCHEAGKLAADYFAGAGQDSGRQRETVLAAFLDRHSACPHRHHEEIAAWLRALAFGQ